MKKLKNLAFGTMAREQGITLISLVITIVLLLIITGTTVYTSIDRFKINNVQKLYNDIDLLDDKISSYYMQYGGLPVLKDDGNNPVSYQYTELNFTKDVNDNENYYILDLSAIGDITLNYGKEGYEQPNESDDVYIINEKTHTVYYVKGVESKDGTVYHSKALTNNINEDNIPPTKPEINVIEGDRIIENNYQTNATIEFVAGKDSWSGVKQTTYSINGSAEENINTLENNIYKLTGKGIYDLTLRTYDDNNNYSEITQKIAIGLEYLESTGTQYIDTGLKIAQGISIEFKARVTEKKAADGVAFFGVTNSSGYGFCSTIGWYWSNYAFAYGDGYSKITDIPIEINEDILIKTNETNIYINGKECNQLETGNMGTFTGNYQDYNLLLLNRWKGVNVDSKGLSGRFYYSKIWDKGTLVRDYIPVIDENGVACLYEKVEGKFYYNAGTGEFKTNLDE